MEPDDIAPEPPPTLAVQLLMVDGMIMALDNDIAEMLADLRILARRLESLAADVERLKHTVCNP